MSGVVFGVIDEPISAKENDELDLQKHSDALIKFIENCATPLTVGIQGEWGSGKTSLLNAIRSELDDRKYIKQIWINSWENSLLASPEESLIKIINEIISELLSSDLDKERREKILGAASTVFKGALRIGATMTLGVKAGEVAEDLISGADQNGIKELRNHLFDLVAEIRSRPTNPYEKVIIYVDDLDRVEPKDAVKILELLKNIFSVSGCVFVLAIDYQVVVKGLEHKFGKQTSENEWEFRAFFDKIIQLPFMMPMGQYNIAKYVNRLLSDVGFGQGTTLDPDIVTSIIKHSIGGNPRSLKRLVNSVALIEIFASNEDQYNELPSNVTPQKVCELLFALVCLQIAYPDIYNLLSEHPNIDTWDEELAYEITQGKEQSDETFTRDFENACKTDDFDEEWEQCVYKICYVKPRYRAKAIDISRAISIVKNEIVHLPTNEMEQVLSALINQTAVTNVTSTDQPKKSQKVWKTEEQKDDANELWNLVLDQLEGKCEVLSRGRRTGSSGTIRIKHKNFNNVTFTMIQGGSLLELRIDGSDIDQNLEIFDTLAKEKETIEKESGLVYEWKRSMTSKRQTIRCTSDFANSFAQKYKRGGSNPVPDRSDWKEYINWMSVYAPKFEKAFLSVLQQTT